MHLLFTLYYIITQHKSIIIQFIQVIQGVTLRNVVTKYTQLNLKVLLYVDNNIDYEKNDAIVQVVHNFMNDP